MAFKFALLAVVCFAQGFAFQVGTRGSKTCNNPAVELPYEFEQAMHEMDDVRDTVSMAAVEAYTRGNSNLKVIIACFREQRDNYVKLGIRVSEMVTDASLELAEILTKKADKYAKLIEVPLRTIAVTIRELPEKVSELIKEMEFVKAAQVMREARKTIDENARQVGKYIRDMAGEVPEVADRAEELAKKIHEESRDACNAINQAFRKCVEEGGPQKPVEEDQDEQSEE